MTIPQSSHLEPILNQTRMLSSAFVSSFLPAPLLSPSLTLSLNGKHTSSTTQQLHIIVPAMNVADDDKKPRFGVKLATMAMTALLALPFPQDALAASSGGRVGGGSFRSTPRSSPARSYRGGSGYSRGYSGYGGGLAPVTSYYSPISPFSTGIVVGGGGASIVSALVLTAGAGLWLRGVAFQNSAGFDNEVDAASRDVAVVTLKVGLLASAIRVRDALDSLARGGETTTARGLSNVLGDATVALLRSSEYWVAASSSLNVARGGDAERLFNEAAIRERSKLARETLSNVGGQKRSAPSLDDTSGMMENVVVTLIVATDAAISKRIPRRGIRSTEDVQKILSALGSISADEMQGLEVLWAPQQRGDSMSRAEMQLEHPELKDL